MAKILIVDDDSTVREVVSTYLSANGHETVEAPDGANGLNLARAVAPDIVVLDLMMPGMNGLDVCSELRKDGDVPIVMLTAMGTEDDRIAGLERGADDYIAKPFSPRELSLRVESILRRVSSSARAYGPLEDGDLAVCPDRREAFRDGEPLSLTAREFDLLSFFITHPGKAYSREQLLEDVWGWSFGDLSTVTVHVRRLREKIEADPSTPSRLCTVWGVGYRWEKA